MESTDNYSKPPHKSKSLLRGKEARIPKGGSCTSDNSIKKGGGGREMLKEGRENF